MNIADTILMLRFRWLISASCKGFHYKTGNKRWLKCHRRGDKAANLYRSMLSLYLLEGPITNVSRHQAYAIPLDPEVKALY